MMDVLMVDLKGLPIWYDIKKGKSRNMVDFAEVFPRSEIFFQHEQPLYNSAVLN